MPGRMEKVVKNCRKPRLSDKIKTPSADVAGFRDEVVLRRRGRKVPVMVWWSFRENEERSLGSWL